MLRVAPPASPPVKPVEPSELYRPCEQGQDSRNSDLCAQWKAADAARDAATWAEWAFWLGIVGTAGLLATLYYTRAAVKAAEAATQDADNALAIAARNADAAAKMAKEARRTNEIARATQLAQLRPYVYIKEMRIEGRRIIVMLNNFGQTPAIDLRVSSNWGVVETAFRGAFPGELHTGDVALELAPSQPIEIGYSLRDMPESHWQDILHDKAMLICELRYSYRDLLGSDFTGHSRQGSKGEMFAQRAFTALPIEA